ncbi:MAG: hypothetical protein IJS52_10615 [Bacilli bacterium]|nr:hypothetical protein [Bacilli bacterium]
MKKLYFKNWYAKKNFCRESDMSEASDLFFAGSTEKAIHFFAYHASGRGGVNVTSTWLPKSALICCETEEEFRELDKKENSEKALESIEEWIKGEVAYSFEDAVKYAKMEYDAYL